MPIVGNLSEFPLPEVLLLIGQRTGRLRLLDVPEFGVLDLDISNGAVQAMRVGADTITETRKMLDKLGAIVQSQCGMFEFRLVPVSVMVHLQALTIHDLAMKLVCYVDEQAAKLRQDATRECHRLVIPQPEIWMEPELNQFFQAAIPLLSLGAPLEELAKKLGLETARARQYLNHLRLLGFIELIEENPPARAEEEKEQVAVPNKKSSAVLRITRLTDKIRQISRKLPSAK